MEALCVSSTLTSSATRAGLYSATMARPHLVHAVTVSRDVRGAGKFSRPTSVQLASSSSAVFNVERSLLVKGQAIQSRRRPAGAQGLVVRGLFGLGVPELAVIAGVAAILFGPKKLPEIGKSLGKTVKSFQQAAKEFESEVKASAAEATKTESGETETPLTPTSAPTPPPTTTTTSQTSDKDRV